MSRMTKRNLHNIKCKFEEKTGVDLNPAHRVRSRVPMRKVLVLAAVLLFCFVLTAFTYPLFSPLDADELSLDGTYLGDGIVSVYVENRSDKDLKFQKQLKLINWFTEEEAPKLEGEVVFSESEFPAGTSGTMTIDLSKAYDIAYLENDVTNPWYYLLLTNRDFLFGHDWMCSVYFNDDGEQETQPQEPAEDAPAENLENIEEELRFYFEKSYEGAPIALNEANFSYLQKVDELLKRCGGTVVPALSPAIMVSEPSVYLDPEPMLKKLPDGVMFDDSVPAEQQYLLGLTEWTHSDAYGRMVASSDEKAWAVNALIPQRQGETDGGVTIPLVFLFVYDAEAASNPDHCAFLYGQLLTFGELEPYKVLEDEHYAIYDATDLIYTDVDAYLDYFLSCQSRVYCDEQIRQRVHNVYDYYRNREHLKEMYGYYEW